MNIAIIAFIVVGVIWLISVFVGFISAVPKTFNYDQSGRINSSAVKSQSQESIETTEEKRKRYMEDMKQKIQDQQRRY